MQRVWELREGDATVAKGLSRELQLPEVVAQLLVKRKITAPEEARSFLRPALADLADPAKMRGMDSAVARLEQALRDNQRVCVFGDYDVDGVTSVSVLHLFLREIGIPSSTYIPSRMEEGYGLNEAAIREIARQGCQLLVTVDCGISDHEHIQLARDLGMDVIVIDHHQVPAELPPANAILNPLQAGCPFPSKDLAAVGVTFNLVMALRASLRAQGFFSRREEPNLREYLDLVALGTIADVVPVLGENRVITAFGLVELNAGRRPGVAALKEVAGILNQKVAVGQVAFRLAPRLNAAGRLGQASLAVELLTTQSFSRALSLARELDRANTDRQAVEQEIFQDALRQAEALRTQGDPRALVLTSEHWHVGVVGIVASRLNERFGCPVVLIAWNGEEGRGSARASDPVHLYQALASCDTLLEGYGGHRAAAGLSIRKERIEDFRAAFLAAVQAQTGGVATSKRIMADLELPPSYWDPGLIQSLEVLAPHGMGNPEPVFIARGLKVRSARVVGKDSPSHLKIVVSSGKAGYDCIGFGMGERLREIGDSVDLLYTPELNLWEGPAAIQLRLRDVRAG